MNSFSSVMRPNYRRARELASEIEVVTDALDEARRDPDGASRSGALLAELHELKHDLFLTGVTSEYDL